ncbi:ECF transporter S component [Thomasclavelia sp.]|uniref:ECF transporter S component n=1 Tax=Thomasclavelia sp. TaxID=3025757 RepID=UPI0025FDB619|nr:ECF transporter S component [Thomasclavelia sp.]
MINKKQLSLILVIFSILTVIAGVLLWQDQRYNLIIILVLIASMLAFYFQYEYSSVKTREVVIVSIMIALAVVGRTLFILLPSVKPVSALIIILAVVFGSQDGFLAGSLSALLSDFVFGMGPWTPFQMIAWGLIGYLAGMFSKQLYQNQWLLYLYGLISGILFSLIMDLWSVLTIEQTFNLTRYLVTFLSSLPVTIIYMISNVVFLILLKTTMFRILQRVKVKYGIEEKD